MIKQYRCKNKGIKITYSKCCTVPSHTTLYRLRNYSEKSLPKFTYPTWFFVTEDDEEFTKSLWNLFQYRKEDKNATSDPLELILDTFVVTDDLVLYYINDKKGTSYLDMENSINDINYEKTYIDLVTGDNIQLAKWLNSIDSNVYGWYDISYPEVLQEIMLLPSAKKYVEHVESEVLGDVFDRLFSN